MSSVFLSRDFTQVEFALPSSLVICFWNPHNKQWKTGYKKKQGKIFLNIFIISSFTTSSGTFSECDAGKVILFQIKVLGRNIK